MRTERNTGAFSYEDRPPVALNPEHYRAGTEASRIPVRYIFSGGGLGDYICWIPALQWIAEQCPQVFGRIYAPAFFFEIAQHFFSGYEGWRTFLIDEVNKETKSIAVGPDAFGRVQMVNALGSHLLDLGFAYYANLSPVPPAYNRYPDLTGLPDEGLPPALRDKQGKYVVFTLGGTTSSRTVPGALWNPLLAWVREQGLTPVLLGKEHLSPTHRAHFPEGTDLTGVIDLREKTSLLEAACIMDRAAAVLGLDNGLLHLAACTNARLLFAYNIVIPEHRSPRRSGRGRTVELSLTPEELRCSGCQSRMKALYTHDFKTCLYRDNLCIEMLFENGAARWKSALSALLEAP